MATITALNDLTRNTALEAQALEARQWAIIMNAVRELCYSIGWDGPYRDNDLRVALAIKGAAARLHGPERSTEAEHLPLSIPGQPTAPEINTITDILEKGLEEALRISAPAAAPAATQKPPRPAQNKA